MEAIILAGGKGTRLANRIKDIPKPMADVGGRPFLEWVLDYLATQGMHRVVLSVGHRHQSIQKHFGETFAGLQLVYAVEDMPLGTGGAVRHALQSAEAESVFVINGDTFLRLQYTQMLAQHTLGGKPVTLAVVHQQDCSRYGRVLIEQGAVVGFQEKGIAGPGWINAGVYLIDRNISWPAGLPESFSFESDFLAPSVLSLLPGAYRCDGYFIDIGIPEDLDRAQTEITEQA